MRQRLNEWLEGCDWNLHERQFQQPYRITVRFCDWLDEQLHLSSGDGSVSVLDVGAGMGANIHYISRRLPRAELVGLEINPECVQRGNQRLATLHSSRCRLECGDLFMPPREWHREFDGIVSFATLSWLPHYQEALKALTSLEPAWLAVTSLFYDGPVDTTITTRDYSCAHASSPYTEKFYNIYSLDLFKKDLRALGYDVTSTTPFEIDIDLPRPSLKSLGTYTERLYDGRRLQISGPLLMPWYFVLARSGSTASADKSGPDRKEP